MKEKPGPAPAARDRRARAGLAALGTLLTAWLLLAGACARHVPPIARLSPGSKILAFGDSLTYGTGVEPADSYPAVLEELSGHPVVNAGVPGEVSEEGLRRLPGILDAERPALLVLCHGGNDLIRQEPEDRLADNLGRMADLAAERGISVVLIGVPKPGIFPRTAAVYEAVARQKSLPLDDVTIPAIEAEPSLKSDPIHPNREGYRKMAQAVFDLLKRSGAL